MTNEYFEQIKNLCKACGLSIEKIARQFNINQDMVLELFMQTMKQIQGKMNEQQSTGYFDEDDCWHGPMDGDE